jgi:3-hydroxybutyryl-CoA dehydrogenase
MTATDPASNAPRAPRFAAVGAGRMGRGIAIAFAWAGHRIALVDLRPRAAAAWQRLHDEALGEIRASLGALAQLGALRADQVDSIAARVSIVPSAGAAAALEAAELVFEGVPERLDAKREAFAQLNRMCRADAILTSTTSSILVTQLAALVERPERFPQHPLAEPGLRDPGRRAEHARRHLPPSCWRARRR